MSDATKVTSLEGTFLLSASARRRRLLTALIEDLGLPEPHGSHVLNAGFIEKGNPDLFYVHVDEAAPTGRTPSRRGRAPEYLVMIGVRERPRGEPPPKIKERKRGIQWALERTSELLGSDRAGCFVECALTLRNRERPPLPRPIAVGAEVVPAVGAEYAITRSDRGLRRLRWSMTSPSEVMNVWLSYSVPYDGDKSLAQWLADSRAMLATAAEGAFPDA